MAVLERSVDAPRRQSAPAAPRRSRRHWLPYLLLLPALLLELLVHIVPMLAAIGMSFLELTQFYVRNWANAPFAGLANYANALRPDSAIGQELLHSFTITAAYTVLVVGLSWLFGFTAAVLLQSRFRGRDSLRTLFLVPYALPIYAAIIIWAFMLQRDTGMVNQILVEQFGLLDEWPFWLIGGNSFTSVVVVSLWRHWPFAFLVIMAGMQNIPRDLYEAAAIDGAGVWRSIRSVTLPLLRPVNQVLLLVLFLWTFNDFNTPYVLFGPSAPREAQLLPIHIYQNSFSTWNFGLGAAMSVVLLLFLMVVTGLYLTLTSRRRSSV